MNLQASVALGAGEERIEREDGPIRRKDGALKFGKKKGKVEALALGQQGGWQYGFRHPTGYIPQRTLSGLPRTPGGKGHLGVPAIPKGPGVARHPNPSLGRGTTGPGMKFPNPSLSKMRVRADSEAAEPPQTGAYSREGSRDKNEWFDDPAKKVKAEGTSEGAEKGWDSRGRGKKEPPKNVHPLTRSFKPVKRAIGNLTPEQIRRFKEVHQKWEEGKLEADFEPTMQHAHMDSNLIFHPPSLTKRKKADHVPTDDVGETNDKFGDVTKRNSQDTWEQRMKMLKRSAPGGLPAQVPARTTLIPMHQGSYLPSAMMSAEKPRLKQRPINWDKQPRQFTSYGRRGSI